MWVVQPGVEWPREMRILWGVARGWKMGVAIVDVDADILIWWCCCCGGGVMVVLVWDACCDVVWLGILMYWREFDVVGMEM